MIYRCAPVLRAELFATITYPKAALSCLYNASMLPLANARNSNNAVESSTGTVFTAPFAFNAIYGPYGNRWLVPATQDLLSACNGKAGPVEHINPREPFYADNLPAKIATVARAACAKAGVEAAPVLNACMVDVAVLGPGGERLPHSRYTRRLGPHQVTAPKVANNSTTNSLRSDPAGPARRSSGGFEDTGDVECKCLVVPSRFEVGNLR